jgi:hypothetical protein
VGSPNEWGCSKDPVGPVGYDAILSDQFTGAQDDDDLREHGEEPERFLGGDTGPDGVEGAHPLQDVEQHVVR